MAKEINSTKGTGSRNPFLTPALTATPDNVDRASLEKQVDAAAPKATAAVKEAEAANPKNTNREITHPELKKLGITAYIVSATEHRVRVKDIDSIEKISETFPGATLTKDNGIKGGRIWVYDPARLTELLANLPKRTGRSAASSSVKYLIESSESLGLDGQHYVVCDAVENVFADGVMTRTFQGVKMHGSYSAENKSGEFTVVRDGKTMKIAMIVKSAREMYPQNYGADGTPNKDVKVPANRAVFVMTPKVTNPDGSTEVVIVKSYGQTNTLYGFMRFFDRIVFE